jgi:hypothetical protein
VDDDKTAPETTREVQRAIADLSNQVAALDLANNTLVTSFDRREAALAALESGMQSMAGDIAAMREGRPLSPRTAGAAQIAAAPPPILAATARSQAIRALSALEAAARGDRPFAREHQALASFLPEEPSLASLAEDARRGVPTLVQLRSDFAGAADRANRVATDQSDDGWNWLRASFAGVVEFEPSQLVATNAEILRNARRLLDFGDARGAIEALASISGEPGEAFSTWRVAAQRRAVLDENLRDLNARLLETAASTGGAG